MEAHYNQPQQQHPVLAELANLSRNITKFYYLALEKAPDVVLNEFPPDMFTRCEGTIPNAAERMAKFWKLRYDIYGEDRFYRPLLDLSGNGLLRPEDVEFLKYGTVCLVGNNILVVDQTNLQIVQEEFAVRRKRQAFYYWSRAALNANTLIVFRLVDEKYANDAKGPIKIFSQIIPTTLKAFNICCICTQPGSRKYFQEVIAPRIVETIGDEKKLRKHIYVHIAKSTKSLSKKLQKLGYSPDQLTTNLGGKINFHEHIQADLKAHGGSSFITQDGPQDVYQDIAVARTKVHEGVEDDDKKPAAKQLVPFGQTVLNQGLEKLQNLAAIAAASFEEHHLSTEPAPPSSSIMDNNSYNDHPVIKEIANLPNELTKYYYNAFKKAPDVVKAEGGPQLFIKCEKTITLAAERMVKYWKSRCDVYGETDYYKSLLDLSGNGIFQEEDIRFLTSGMSYLLPNNFVIADQRNIPVTSISIERRKRQSLFLTTKAAQRSSTISIFRIVHYSMANDTNLIEAGPVKFIDAISPVRVKEIHICCICTSNSRIHFERVVVPRMMLDFGKELQNLIQIHMGKSEQSLSKKLEKLGYPPSQFTPNLGGTFDLKKLLHDTIKQHGGRLPDEKSNSNQEESYNNAIIMEDQENDDGDRKPQAKVVQNPKKQHHLYISSTGGRHPLLQEFAKLPKELSKFYYMAAERNPEVVEVESAPELFARCETTLSAAANRMALYWKFRYNIYGETDFCKSVLDLSGNGILQKDDIEFLKTGVNILLPDNVVVVDHSRLSGHTTDYSAVRKRGGFFLWTRAALQGEYLTIVRLVHETMKFDRNTMQLQVIKLLQDVVPVKLKEFHVCCLYPAGARKHFEQVVAPQALSLFDKSMLDIVHVHVAKSLKELSKKLEVHELKKTELPPNLGGSFDFYKMHLEKLVELGAKNILVETTDTSTSLKNTPISSKVSPPKSKSNVISKGPPKKRKACNSVKEGIMETAAIKKKRKVDIETKEYNGAVGGSSSRVKVVRPLDLMKLAQALTDANEYHEACQEDPEVVEKESDPSLFLQLPDPAPRLASYWKQRKEWFGPDRAFRSILDLSGEGALSVDDIKVLKQGNQVNIPDDRSKHKVFFWKSMPQSASEMRCLMYWMTAASLASSLSQEEGIVLILTSPNNINNDLYNLLDNSMPVRVHAVHVCCLNEEDTSKALVIPSARVHVADSLTSVLPKLQACGFTKKNLPTEVGGVWKYDSLHIWLQEQQGDLPTPVAVSMGASSMNALEGLAEAAEKARVEDRKNRKRKNDAMYARKRRLREKNEEGELKESCKDLNQRNAELKAENARLEKMLAEAKSKVAFVEYGMSIASNDDESCTHDNNFDSKVDSDSATSSSSECDDSDDDDDDNLTPFDYKQRSPILKAVSARQESSLDGCNSVKKATIPVDSVPVSIHGASELEMKQPKETLNHQKVVSPQHGMNVSEVAIFLSQKQASATANTSSENRLTAEQLSSLLAATQSGQAVTLYHQEVVSPQHGMNVSEVAKFQSQNQAAATATTSSEKRLTAEQLSSLLATTQSGQAPTVTVPLHLLQVLLQQEESQQIPQQALRQTMNSHQGQQYLQQGQALPRQLTNSLQGQQGQQKRQELLRQVINSPQGQQMQIPFQAAMESQHVQNQGNNTLSQLQQLLSQQNSNKISTQQQLSINQHQFSNSPGIHPTGSTQQDQLLKGYLQQMLGDQQQQQQQQQNLLQQQHQNLLQQQHQNLLQQQRQQILQAQNAAVLAQQSTNEQQKLAILQALAPSRSSNNNNNVNITNLLQNGNMHHSNAMNNFFHK